MDANFNLKTLILTHMPLFLKLELNDDDNDTIQTGPVLSAVCVESFDGMILLQEGAAMANCAVAYAKPTSK